PHTNRTSYKSPAHPLKGYKNKMMLLKCHFALGRGKHTISLHSALHKFRCLITLHFIYYTNHSNAQQNSSTFHFAKPITQVKTITSPLHIANFAILPTLQSNSILPLHNHLL